MPTLEELYSSWSEDAKIDHSEAGMESLNIPMLHNKYLKLLSSERLTYFALNEKRKQLENTLEDYYSGRVDGRDIGRAPYQFIAGTRSKVEKIVATDDEMVKLNLQIALSEEKMLYLKEVVNSINQRNWNLKNYIEWQKFTQGVML